MQSSSQIVAISKLTPNFLQAGCLSCRPTNSAEALKGKVIHYHAGLFPSVLQLYAAMLLSFCVLGQLNLLLPVGQEMSSRLRTESLMQLIVAIMYLIAASQALSIMMASEWLHNALQYNVSSC